MEKLPFEIYAEKEVARRLRSVAAGIRKRARKFGGNIEGAMLDIAAAIEEACCQTSGDVDRPGRPREVEEWAKRVLAQKLKCVYCGGALSVVNRLKAVCHHCQIAFPAQFAALEEVPKAKTSRCCNAEIGVCDGVALCTKCRLTSRV